jgi:type IV pilus assembly protein PilE
MIGMKSRGFTLIEVMIVVTILGILAAIAIPNFTDSMNKSRRSEGISALLGLQQAQARLRANHRFYAQTIVAENHNSVVDNVLGAGAADTLVEFITTSEPEGYYAISIGTTADGYTAASANSYTLVAAAQGRQLGDANCRRLVLTVNGSNPDGVRTSFNNNGTASTGCW